MASPSDDAMKGHDSVSSSQDDAASVVNLTLILNEALKRVVTSTEQQQARTNDSRRIGSETGSGILSRRPRPSLGQSTSSLHGLGVLEGSLLGGRTNQMSRLFAGYRCFCDKKTFEMLKSCMRRRWNTLRSPIMTSNKVTSSFPWRVGTTFEIV
jgi:hypothetical protein